MRIVYMGTPKFAVNPLESLINASHTIIGVFTQPDKPVGRKQILESPAVKLCAIKHNIPVFQPKSLKDNIILNTLKELSPDIIVVVAYGKILPKEIIDLPKYGCINVHASLLPKLRGAAPIQWAVINGENITGVTTMYMDEGIDTGDILLQVKTKIEPEETSGELHDRLAEIGADLIVETIDKLQEGTIERKKQNNLNSTYTIMLNKSIAGINWKDEAQKIHNKVRGLNPWPIATSSVYGKKVKIYKTKISEQQGESGMVISVSPFVVGTANGSIEIIEIQSEGKKKMLAQDYLRGNKIKVGTRFDEF